MSFLLNVAMLLYSVFPSDTIKQVCDLPGTTIANITQPVVIAPSSNIRFFSSDTSLGTGDIVNQDIQIAGDSSFFLVQDMYFHGKLKVGNSVLGSRRSLDNDIIIGSSYFYDDVSFSFQSTERVHFYNCTFREALRINEVRLHYLYLDACSFPAGLDLARIAVDGITLSNIKTGRLIDLSYIRPNVEGDRILIDLTNSDPASFKIDFKYCKLGFSVHDFDNACSIYTYYINQASERGEMITGKILQKDFIEYKAKKLQNVYASGLPVAYWWDYDVVQYYVLYWLPGLLLILIIINASFVKRMNSEVYEVERLTAIINRSYEKSALSIYYASFVYTSVIFFKVYVSFEKLKFENRGLLAFFITIYLSGIICLFYLGKYIFNT